MEKQQHHFYHSTLLLEILFEIATLLILLKKDIHQVSSMAEWLRHSLAEWKVLGLNLTMGKVSEKFWLKTKMSDPVFPPEGGKEPV